MQATARPPAQSLPVYDASDLTVVSGANLSDSLSFATELELADIYELRVNASLRRLSVVAGDNGSLTIAADSTLGRSGAVLFLDSCLTMMSTAGETSEILVLVEVDGEGHAVNVYALPLAPLAARTGYSLIGIDCDNARHIFAQVACVSFSRGTRITMASGAQKPVEELEIGDLVLTRDSGVQAIRWIGESTVRAMGEFAPTRVKAGTLHNENDLLIPPDHRLFIYQRSDALGAGRHEVLVRARHLVNGDTVVRQPGGFVDYFQILLDAPHIIFAEGIAAETFRIDSRTRDVLPEELHEKLSGALPGHERCHMAYEVSEALLARPDAAGLLKRASMR